ncbi:hypothetical protein ACTJKO_00315 [Curtobacterium sp. 22159]|uniref:hypothetical protein n=1 Tax=Curtobacterium sp. 22159 TaxID=3453882 RepID=UPI003F84EA29
MLEVREPSGRRVAIPERQGNRGTGERGGCSEYVCPIRRGVHLPKKSLRRRGVAEAELDEREVVLVDECHTRIAQLPVERDAVTVGPRSLLQPVEQSQAGGTDVEQLLSGRLTTGCCEGLVDVLERSGQVSLPDCEAGECRAGRVRHRDVTGASRALEHRLGRRADGVVPPRTECVPERGGFP